MDVTQALKDTENALRDFIAEVLTASLGADWVNSCGVGNERVVKWKDRQEVERKRQETGVVDERLIYYADFYDVKTILKKNWSGEFSTALGDWKTIEVYLTELERYRDPDAHRRELLPHQKALITGIAGEIRTRLIRYRNKRETLMDYFPRIECARDSLGNIWTPQSDGYSKLQIMYTGMRLHPGDFIEFVVTARDPEDLKLEYSLYLGTGGFAWQENNNLSLTITQEHISTIFQVFLYIRSSRPYHAYTAFDDNMRFSYSVLPSQ